MRYSDFAEIYDHAKGLACHFIPVSSATEAFVEQFRKMYIARASEIGYVGFSYEIDDIFHLRSTYICITEAEKAVMVCRVTPRPPGTILPFEMGVREDGGSYKLADNEKAADLAAYTHIKGHYQNAPSQSPAALAALRQLSGLPTSSHLHQLFRSTHNRRVTTKTSVCIL